MKTDKNKGWVNVDEVSQTQKNGHSQYKFEYNGETYDPYAMSKSHKIPVWLKAVFGKWWIPGAVFYFIFFGFEGGQSSYVFATVLGLVCGMATDVLLNRIFRGFSSEGHDYTRYIFCGRKDNVPLWRRFITLPINLVYYVEISIVAAFIIDNLIIALLNAKVISSYDDFLFAVGALLYATIMLILDLIFVGIRNLVELLIKKAREKKSIVSTQTEDKPQDDLPQ